MPTYEYKCDACGNEFEKFQSITAAPIKKCPKCGKNKVRRLIGTGAGLIFKGSGFYITDYRDKSYAEKAKAESGTATAGTDAKAHGKGGGKGDGKPASGDAGAKAETAKPAAANNAAPESKSAAPTERKTAKRSS